MTSSDYKGRLKPLHFVFSVLPMKCLKILLLNKHLTKCTWHCINWRPVEDKIKIKAANQPLYSCMDNHFLLKKGGRVTFQLFAFIFFFKKNYDFFFGNTIKIISCNTKPCTGLPMCPVLNFRKIEWVVLAYMGTLHTS